MNLNTLKTLAITTVLTLAIPLQGCLNNTSKSSSYENVIEKYLQNKYSASFHVTDIRESDRNTWMERTSYTATVIQKDTNTEFTVIISGDKKDLQDNYQKIIYSDDINNIIAEIYASCPEIHVSNSEYIFEPTDKTWDTINEYIKSSGSYINMSFSVYGDSLEDVAESISEFFREIEKQKFSCIVDCNFSTPLKSGTVGFASTESDNSLDSVDDILYKLKAIN